MRISHAAKSSNATSAYEFGDFRLDANRGALTQGGKDVHLRPKTYSVLLHLVENSGRLVSRDELLDSIWGETIVSDGAVTQCLIEIRKLLGDDDQSKIRTVPKRGYAFEMQVRSIVANEAHDKVAGESRLFSWQVALAALCIATLVGVAIWQLAATSPEPDHESFTNEGSRTAPSIAVLPFADMSPGQDHQYFADGMSEEILTLLTSVPDIKVIARTSSFSFRGQDVSIADIARRLDVSHVLQGSVRRSDDRIRVAVQLIDALNSEQIWSATFDGTLDDIFKVQDDISTAVVEQLEGTLSAHLTHTGQAIPEAYSLYLQALYMLGEDIPGAVRKAEALLTEAVKIDPNSAPIWRELARIRWRTIGLGASPSEDVDALKEALNRAVEIDPDDPVTLAYLAAAMADLDGDVAGAARMFERAIEANPADEHILRMGLIFLMNHAVPEDAIAFGEYGIQRNPVCYLCAQNLCRAYLRAGRHDAAELLAKSIVSTHDRGHWLVGISLLLQGRANEALDWFAKDSSEDWQIAGAAMALADLSQRDESEKLITKLAESSIEWTRYGSHIKAYAWTGHPDKAFEALYSSNELLQKYYSDEVVRKIPWQMSTWLRSPLLTPLHKDPRWEPLARELGVHHEQVADLNFTLSLPTNSRQNQD